jgi:exodeoxyribonuclease VII small subunit
MTDEQYTFEQTRVRLEGILVEVRKKDTSLEQSLELLEEGVRLLNQCNELIDQTAWRPVMTGTDESEDAAEAGADSAVAGEPLSGEGAAVDTAVDEPADQQPARDDESAADGSELAAAGSEPADDEPGLEDDERD